MEKITRIKEQLEKGSYNMDYAVETTAEKLVLLKELDLW